jgi:hypothetical protein
VSEVSFFLWRCEFQVSFWIGTIITEPKRQVNYLNSSEKRMWKTNIENTASTVAEQYGNEVVKSVFRRYDAHGLYDLSPCYYSEVFGDLEQIASDN